MIIQSNMLDFMLKVNPSAKDIKTSKPSIDSSFPSFKNVLENTMGNAQNARSVNKMDFNARDVKEANQDVKANGTENPGSNRREQVKAFREISKDNVKEVSSKKVEENDSHENTGNEEVKTEDIKEKVKALVVMDSLAQTLGINQEDFMKLLNYLNIKPEDLTDATKLTAAVDKISQVLGLDIEQKQALTDLIGMMSKKVSEAMTDMEKKIPADQWHEKLSKSSKENKDWVKVDNANIKVEKTNEPVLDMQGMAAKMKLKLGEIATELQKNPQAVFEGLSRQVENKLAQMKADDTHVTQEEAAKAEPQVMIEQTVSTGKEMKNDTNGDKTGSDAKNLQENTGIKEKSDKSEAQTEEPVVKESAVEVKPVVVANNQINVKNEAANVTQANIQPAAQVQNTESAIKVQKEINIPRHEIINQVVEKAKVTITPEKSEMAMELKPESLGKLSLKVVTEHGMVVAKFIAESQQVKEVIESNMQLLKDSLEKQGMTIQGFSVSVGQQNTKDSGRNFEFKENRKESKGTSSYGTVGVVGISDLSSGTKTPNPYEMNQSSINLTA